MKTPEQSSMRVAHNEKNISEMNSTTNVPLDYPHVEVEEVEFKTNPTQLQSILPAEVPMAMWDQSPMSDGHNQKNLTRMKSTADVLYEAAEVEEETQEYRDRHTNCKGNKDKDEFKEVNIVTHDVTGFSTMMNQAVSNLMQEFRRWRPRITRYQKGHSRTGQRRSSKDCNWNKRKVECEDELGDKSGIQCL